MLRWKGKSSEEENKSRVSAIHDLKEKLKSENEELKKIKHKLKDVQEKQKAEKEVSFTENSLINLRPRFNTKLSREIILQIGYFSSCFAGKTKIGFTLSVGDLYLRFPIQVNREET